MKKPTAGTFAFFRTGKDTFAVGSVLLVLGVLLAAPVMGTLRVLLRYVYAKILDQEPYIVETTHDGELYPGEIDAVFFDLDGTLIETDDDDK